MHCGDIKANVSGNTAFFKSLWLWCHNHGHCSLMTTFQRALHLFLCLFHYFCSFYSVYGPFMDRRMVQTKPSFHGFKALLHKPLHSPRSTTALLYITQINMTSFCLRWWTRPPAHVLFLGPKPLNMTAICVPAPEPRLVFSSVSALRADGVIPPAGKGLKWMAFCLFSLFSQYFSKMMRIRRSSRRQQLCQVARFKLMRWILTDVFRLKAHIWFRICAKGGLCSVPFRVK